MQMRAFPHLVELRPLLYLLNHRRRLHRAHQPCQQRHRRHLEKNATEAAAISWEECNPVLSWRHTAEGEVEGRCEGRGGGDHGGGAGAAGCERNLRARQSQSHLTQPHSLRTVIICHQKGSGRTWEC